MAGLLLAPLGLEEEVLLQGFKKKLTFMLGVSSNIRHYELDLNFFFDSDRQQYNAAKIIQAIEQKTDSRTLLLTSADLFIPIFTFVFGLAKLGGQVAIISNHRLKNSFYGLPEDDKLLEERMLKESIHEFGHLLTLRHCVRYDCVMAHSTSSDEIDLKGQNFCRFCEKILKEKVEG